MIPSFRITNYRALRVPKSGAMNQIICFWICGRCVSSFFMATWFWYRSMRCKILLAFILTRSRGIILFFLRFFSPCKRNTFFFAFRWRNIIIVLRGRSQTFVFHLLISLTKSSLMAKLGGINTFLKLWLRTFRRVKINETLGTWL